MKLIPLHERNICIIANDETKKELENTDWTKLGLDILTNNFSLASRLWNNRKNLENSYKKKVPYPIYNIDEARKSFKFPPSHPQNGIVYATSEIDDLLYVPLSSFHKYMYESKMASFTELCASLGAKNCKILYAEENDIDITSKLKLQNIPTSSGVLNSDFDFGYNKKNSQDADIFFSFPKQNSIKEYDNVWMNGEPTWKTLQKLRLENDVEKYTTEFNYSDDLGVTADIANSLNGIGFNIGGTFQKLKKTRYKFEVEFWPKNNIV